MNNIRLEDDFYRYVNKDWLDKNPVPSEYTRWGTFEKLGKKNLEQLIDLIKNKCTSTLR